ncbi:MAG: hypothetical protein JO110_22450 [Acetobacteraceae bacterium]|nr:hypothetical protein [Acetobacteraceae bacterium]
MVRDYLSLRVVILGASVLAIAYAGLLAYPCEAASSDYAAPQVAPASALPQLSSMAQIAAILNETAPGQSTDPPVALYQVDSWDNATQGRASAAPLKIVQTDLAKCSDTSKCPPYLGVFHNPINSTQFATYLSYSADLKSWYTLGQIHSPAAQPDIRILSDDSVIYAEEYNPSGRPYIRVHYYGNPPGTGVTGLQALINNPATTPTSALTFPGTPFAKADGTPEFGRISYSGSISSSELEITHHYFHLGQRDLQADGTLTNFESWSSSSDDTINDLVSSAGGNGKIGDREIFKAGPGVYEVVEAQVNPTSGNDFGSWRLFLIDRTKSVIQKLSPVLKGGAQSLGNPTVSFVTLPNGAPALVFTCFIFGTNNGMTPPGGYLFVYPFQ